LWKLPAGSGAVNVASRPAYSNHSKVTGSARAADMPHAYLSLGSNLEPEWHLTRALRHFDRHAPSAVRLSLSGATADVHDAEQYERYKAAAPETIAAYGGSYVARGGELAVLEGDWQPRRVVILQFAIIGLTNVRPKR